MLSLLAFIFACHVAHGAEVCYMNLGCFSNIAPFWGLNRPLSALPDAPDVIGTKFYLNTRANPTMALRERLVSNSPATFSASHFSSSRPSMMIIHGFTHSAQHDWVQRMVDELLKKEDANVVTVEWSEGATLTGSYEQAVANTRVVGAQVAELITYMGNYEVSGQNFHIIGHSLGAQIAGYAGDTLGNLARITALDAAEPYFDGMDAVVRLDPTDARFVDVIHTDGSPFIGTLGMGTNLPIGHVDFYPNNGMYQPGCNDNVVSTVVATGVGLLTDGYDGAEAALACSHLKALDFFTESINSECPFTAYPCESYEKFKQGFCLSCPSSSSCSQMGARARDHYGARGSMYLMTTDGSNGKYCAYHYKVQVTSSNPMAQAAGRIYVTFQGPTGITDSMEVTDDNIQLQGGVTYQKTVISPEEIGDVTRVHVRFARSSSLWDIFAAQYYTLNKVTITAGESQDGYRFCAGDTQIRNGETITLTAAGGNC